MYMYYLLGYNIYEQHSDQATRDRLTKNTFILALDGDINFKPEAVLLLLDLMRNNSNLGAACGRVHPMGSGPMAWYQKFEYAVSHWLQKATEHVFGCVLCSPGCFSLFRAQALVDTMNRYTTTPTEAIHYVQYDQGEDRWLCTLMLQQGWRVEYSAASDCFTHCPEGFDEFFIQRRRWAPSTMANILDLLQSYKHTIHKNDNISFFYILYQAGIMLGTILSPGTIFLMLVGASNTAFGFRNEYSFYFNFIPVLGFILVCFFAKTETQILVAQILSIFYVMLMLAVMISTGIQIEQDTVWSPSVIFFIGLITIFVVSAVIHPQEIACLFHSILYLLTIPSMYLLLTIYSIINLNIVTWGTRENPQQQEQEKQQEQLQQMPAKSEDKAWYDIGHFLNKASKWSFNILCCASTKNDEELYHLRDIKDHLIRVNTEIIEIKTKLGKSNDPIKSDKNVTFSETNETRYFTEHVPKKSSNEKSSEELNSSRTKWVTNSYLKEGKLVTIGDEEKKFWIKFIKKYLKPLTEDQNHKDKIKSDLIDLRNKVVFAFGIINILFVLFVYLLQLHKDMFSIQIRVKHKANWVLNDTTNEWENVWDDKFVDMDPVGLALIGFFGTIMIIQVIGMFIHRFGTLTHLLAFTKLNILKINEDDIKSKNVSEDKVLLFVKYLLGSEYNKESFEQPTPSYYNMEVVFKENFKKVDPEKTG